MRGNSLILALALTACGSASASSGGGATTPPPPDPSTWRADLQCNDTSPAGAYECVARGCEWRAPYRCSGIDRPDDFLADRGAICACVCDRDLIECMSQP